MEDEDLLLFPEDIIKAYAERRLHLEERDVKDLLRCVLLFIQKQNKNNKYYAIELPHIGFLHKKLKTIQETLKGDNFMHDLIIEDAYDTNEKMPLFTREEKIKRYYPDFTKDEIQQYQNNSQED